MNKPLILGLALGVLTACHTIAVRPPEAKAQRDGQLCGRTSLNCATYRPAGKTDAQIESDLKSVREAARASLEHSGQ